MIKRTSNIGIRILWFLIMIIVAAPLNYAAAQMERKQSFLFNTGPEDRSEMKINNNASDLQFLSLEEKLSYFQKLNNRDKLALFNSLDPSGKQFLFQKNIYKPL